jgi:hypothetical protein
MQKKKKVRLISVKVSDILPSPFRDLNTCPLNPIKLKHLTQSIESTFLWPNILVRPSPRCRAKYETAQGHHRVEAARQIDPEGEIEVAACDLSDSEMLSILAQENGEEWGGDAWADIETIQQVRKYLSEHPEELQKTRDAADTRGDSFPSAPKSGGPGKETLAAILRGTWSPDKVKHCLDVINAIEKREVSEDAIRKLPTLSAARRFVYDCRKKGLTPTGQEQLAGKIAARYRADADDPSFRDFSAGFTEEEVFDKQFDPAEQQAKSLQNKFDNMLKYHPKDLWNAFKKTDRRLAAVWQLHRTLGRVLALDTLPKPPINKKYGPS